MDLLECVYNRNHIVCYKPILVFSCSSNGSPKFACAQCVQNLADVYGAFMCKLCCVEHKIRLISKLEDLETHQKLHNTTLIENSKQILAALLARLKSAKLNLKDVFSSVNRRYVIDNTFEFIQQDMIIRVESMHIELDKVESETFSKINKLEIKQARVAEAFNSHMASLSQVTNRPCSSNASLDDRLKFMRKLETLVKNVTFINKSLASNNSTKTLNTCTANKKSTTHGDLSTQIQYLTTIAELAKRAARLGLKPMQLTENSKISPSNKRAHKRPNPFPFVENKNSLVAKTVIGYLNCQTRALALDRRLDPSNESNFKMKVTNLRDFLVSACGMAEVFTSQQKYELIVTDFNNGSVKFFRKFDMHLANETEMTRVVKKTGYFKFKGFGLYPICTDLEFVKNTRVSKPCENVYVCDMDLPRILIFDPEMERLKRIIYSTKSVISDPKEEFDCPRDICYHAGFLYVLDQGKKMVNVFTRAGDYVRDFDYEKASGFRVENAWSVRVAKNVVALIDWLQRVYIFDAEFNLRSVIEESCVTSMCLVDDCETSEGGHVKLLLHTENGDFIVYKLFNDIKDDEEQPRPVQLVKKHFDRLRYRSEFMIYSHSHQVILSLGWSKSIAIIDF